MRARRHCAADRRAKRGFALLSVLIGLAILGLIAAVVLSGAFASRSASHIALERAQAEALAEAGINDAILSLLWPPAGRAPRLDGVSYVFAFAGREMKVSIQDERGKIDLNFADSPLLTRLFTAVGLPAAEASAMADRVQDWRSPGIGKRLNGATADDYPAAGYDYRPRGKPFQSVDELKLVLGITPDLFMKVAPVLTVYSHRGAVNRQTASRQVLEILGAGNVDAVEQLLANRGAGLPGGTASLADWAFTIRAEVPMPAGGVFVREAVIRITGDPAHPYWVHGWREGRPHPAP